MHRVRCVDTDLQAEITNAVLTAFGEMLDEKGMPEPAPYHRHQPSPPDRIDLALKAASETMDSAKAGDVLLDHVNGILEDPEADEWVKLKAVGLCLKLLALHDKRSFADLQAMGELARAEVVAMASAPKEDGVTVNQVAEIAKAILEPTKANV